MARTLRPPASIDIRPSEKSLFLAGSIDLGNAPPWQIAVEEALADIDGVILNPRRDNWDAGWEQSLDNRQFVEQVEWELQGQEVADVIAMYFEPETKAPVTLLELGLFARSGKLIVCCPAGFWRKGNVDVVCKKYGAMQVSSLEEMIAAIRRRFRR